MVFWGFAFSVKSCRMIQCDFGNWIIPDDVSWAICNRLIRQLIQTFMYLTNHCLRRVSYFYVLFLYIHIRATIIQHVNNWLWNKQKPSIHPNPMTVRNRLGRAQSGLMFSKMHKLIEKHTQCTCPGTKEPTQLLALHTDQTALDPNRRSECKNWKKIPKLFHFLSKTLIHSTLQCV